MPKKIPPRASKKPSPAAANKKAAMSFLRLIIAGKIREAYGKYASPKLRHHNPFFAAEPETLIRAMEANEVEFPGKIFEIQRAIADGALVAVHSHLKLKSGELDMATVHIMKFDKDKIVEFWDIAQQIPKESPNTNTMF
jgi:predicted SnoaL-like aldol condensation-catalyzing enzyme